MDVWEQDFYYDKAGKGSLYVKHKGMQILIQIANKSEFVLDMGCGDGTRLNIIAKNKSAIGVDISTKAIKRAKTKYPKLKFVQADLEKLPFKNNSFDLVYSAFVLEHVNNPERVLKQALRVLKSNGHLLLMSPNYGAPNRACPVNKSSRIIKLMKGLGSDLLRFFRKSNSLQWQKVRPMATSKVYWSDWDTTVEPYLGSLLVFLTRNKLKIIEYSCVWEEEFTHAKLCQKVARLLSKIGIYPFKYWGPHLVVLAKK